MPFNGSGTFAPVGPPAYPPIPGTVISSAYFKQLINDICNNGLTKAITRDGQSPPTANLPMNNKKLTGLAAGTANGDSVRFEQLQNLGVFVGPTAPSPTVAGQLWIDTSTNPDIMKQRSADNTTWEILWIMGATNWFGHKYATTSTINIVSAAGGTINHNLGFIPAVIVPFLLCTSADAGYVATDYIQIPCGPCGAVDTGVSFSFDAATGYQDLDYRFGSAANVFSFPHKTTGVLTALTNANWDLYVTLYTL